MSGLAVTAEDARAAVDAVGEFLESDPVQHNLVPTLLEARAAHPEPGRYAWVLDGNEIVGVAARDGPAHLGAERLSRRSGRAQSQIRDCPRPEM